jgi:hypothetical protein
MKRIIPTLWLGLLALLGAGESKPLTFDFETWPEGDPPADQLMVVEGDFTIKTLSGNKIMEVGSSTVAEANALLGPAASGSASIETRVFATKAGRSYPSFGIGVHGQTGYRLMMAPAANELRLTKGGQVVKTVPFVWKSETWLRLKLEVKKGVTGIWTITAKAWPSDAAQPLEPSIELTDAKISGLGRASLWATPFSGTPIDFDDVRVTVQEQE